MTPNRAAYGVRCVAIAEITALIFFAVLQKSANAQFGSVEPGTTGLPTSDHVLRCVVNLNGYAANYPVERWAGAPLVTDLSIHKGSHSDEPALFEKIVADAMAFQPTILMGRYISGARVQTKFTRFPQEAVDAQRFPRDWLRGGTDRVDLENSDAADLFVELILDQHQTMRRPILFVDNIVHPSALQGWVPWPSTCEFLRKLRRSLNEEGSRLIANVAVASWAMNEEDVTSLSDAVDGMSFEMPFHPTARTSAPGIVRQISVYRNWLDARKTVIFIAVDRTSTSDVEREREARFIAGFAMIVRRPGDSLFVAWPYFRTVPTWQSWPAQFGAPVGDYHFNQRTFEISRTFARAVVRINTISKEVEVFPAGSKP